TRVHMRDATLTLLQPDGPGVTADFAADRGEGILGVSIKVRDLAVAHRLVEHNTGLTLPIIRHHGRDRFLVPPPETPRVLPETTQEARGARGGPTRRAPPSRGRGGLLWSCSYDILCIER